MRLDDALSPRVSLVAATSVLGVRGRGGAENRVLRGVSPPMLPGDLRAVSGGELLAEFANRLAGASTGAGFAFAVSALAVGFPDLTSILVSLSAVVAVADFDAVKGGPLEESLGTLGPLAPLCDAPTSGAPVSPMVPPRALTARATAPEPASRARCRSIQSFCSSSSLASNSSCFSFRRASRSCASWIRSSSCAIRASFIAACSSISACSLRSCSSFSLSCSLLCNCACLHCCSLWARSATAEIAASSSSCWTSLMAWSGILLLPPELAEAAWLPFLPMAGPSAVLVDCVCFAAKAPLAALFHQGLLFSAFIRSAVLYSRVELYCNSAAFVAILVTATWPHSSLSSSGQFWPSLRTELPCRSRRSPCEHESRTRATTRSLP